MMLCINAGIADGNGFTQIFFNGKMVCNAVRRNASAFVSVANESRLTLILVAAQIRGKKLKIRSAHLRVRRKARKKSAFICDSRHQRLRCANLR